jgi:hypothetical protein
MTNRQVGLNQLTNEAPHLVKWNRITEGSINKAKIKSELQEKI